MACCLNPDLEILPAGDATEIGERGINLSGGQKQRVSIARAVYANSDIYLFDDSLSAVDADVGKQIFDNVLGPKGLLMKKAKVFVTHGIHFLPHCDYVIMLKNGAIEEKGSYDELMKQEKHFASLIKDYRGTKEVSSTPVASPELKSIPLDIPRNTKAPKSKETGTCQGRLITKEEAAVGSVDYKVYAKYAKACSFPALIFVVFLAILSQALLIYQNVVLSWWSAENDKLNGQKANFVPWITLYGILGFSYAIVMALIVICTWVFCGIRAARSTHDNLLENIMKLPLSFFDTTPLGRIMNRFSKDQYTVDEVLPQSFIVYIRTLFTVMGILAIQIIGNPFFVFLIIPLALLYYYFQRYYLSTSRELKRLDSITRSPIYSHFQETIAGVSSIRAYSKVDRFIDNNERKLDLNQKAYYASVSSNRWLAVRLEFIGSLVVFGSSIFGAVTVLLSNTRQTSMIGLMVSFSLTITQTLNWMVRQSCEIETNIVSVERIKEYSEEITPEAPFYIEESLPDESWPHLGAVKVQGFSTKYRSDLDFVLKNVSFSINPAEKIGVVGRTGAGKSSLTLALFRIIEAYAGNIVIDGIDIATIGLHSLRSKLTIIPQDSFLFAGTIRENLDPFDKHSDDELWSSLEKANLKEHVSLDPLGLDRLILQSGEGLSVGQRQLMCLTRAILRKSKLLILDEATAAIDVETDKLIQQTIRNEMKSSTIITIAHRINTVMDYDRILVLENGQVAEFDTPKNLLKNRNSRFYFLAKEAGQV
jgi:ATP-binding cassette subfamily C (CFTR/MRP) protein 1